MLGHSLAICRPAYAHLARFARYACNIPGTQDEAARVMDEILTPIPIDLRDLKTENSWTAADLSESCRITHDTNHKGDFQ